MRIVTRYVLREHLGPLVFALTAATSLLMLQYVARQLANLAGKGLPWSAIGKFFLLSLPFTVAMTMPMAVLVATLHAFGRMASEHEITAFKASGVRVRTLMAPVLVAALGISLTMVLFNDQVLPRANHKLRVLQHDIARTKPALALREQVLNTITEQFVMKVSRSNAGTGEIHDVVIYDLSNPFERKTIYADSGRISLAPNGRDLQLELRDGHVQEFVKGNGQRLQRTFFREQYVKVRGISQGFQLSGSDNYKSDREMSVCELHDRYKAAGKEYTRLRTEYLSFADKREVAHHVLRNPRTRPEQQTIATLYCGALAALGNLAAPKEAHAATMYQQSNGGQESQQQQISASATSIDSVVVQDSVLQGGTLSTLPDSQLQQVVQPPPPIAPPAPATTAVTGDSAFITSMFLSTTTRLVDQRTTLDQVAVEIHKKFALSFACLVFVLFGPPIALRFPRGGVGVTIGVSIVVFGIYYIFLMGGEALADNGKLPPFIAMWIANVIFGITGLVLLLRIERTTDTSRGGGIADWWADRKANKAMKKAEQKARLAATAGAA